LLKNPSTKRRGGDRKALKDRTEQLWSNGMSQPRKSLISLGDAPFYHCTARCVRRAFLCGVDQFSGVNYEHERDWLEHKLHHTAEAFAIKLCAYAVMNNHYHVVRNVRTERILVGEY
jgi:hypothetical protein